MSALTGARPRLALYHPAGLLALPDQPFGKDVANAALFRALAQHGGFAELHVLNQLGLPAAQVAASFAADAPGLGTSITAHPLNSTAAPTAAGALIRGQPYLAELAWLRRSAGPDHAYSLVGLIHTLAPPAVRERIGANLTAPVQSWDALICTSAAVQQALASQLQGWAEHLAQRCGGQPPPLPQLPLIPLGVDVEQLAAQAANVRARAALRQRLAVPADAVLVLWVGRLSFYEKAFPQPMLQALQLAARQCAEQAGPRLHFAMAGWFPGGDTERQAYLQAAQHLAPEVPLHLLDGQDPAVLAQAWAAADLFLSLVDNIQETFGLAPVEAMAAGLPVVVSDWDGYRATVQHGVQGLRIPSLLPPANPQGVWLADLHGLGMETYPTYAGAVAQHTAVHVGEAAAAITALACDPDRRRRMGAAGQRQARQHFAWPVVVAQIQALLADLAERRAAAPARRPGQRPLQRSHPLAGDPFGQFAGFATRVLTSDRRCWLAPQPPGQPLPLAERLEAVLLDRQYAGLRLGVTAAQQMLERLAQAGEAGCSLAELGAAFPQAPAGSVATTLVWLAKLGYVDWRPSPLPLEAQDG